MRASGRRRPTWSSEHGPGRRPKPRRFEAHPGALEHLPQNLLVVALLALLLVVPGWLAAGWLGIRTTVDRIALIPGMSIVIVLLSGIAVLAVWRGPLGVAKGWVVVALAIGVGIALRLADAWLRRPLEAFGAFFTAMFSAFSNRDFSVLVGVTFLAQAGQGVVQGAIAKSLAFGGQQGFDVQNLPSADYLLTVVLALYVPVYARSHRSSVCSSTVSPGGASSGGPTS